MNKLLSRSDDSQFPFWIFTISVFIIAVLPSLIQDGMFIDGTQYAAVSKNMANGLGTFWAPYLSQNWYQNIYAMGSNVFLENPPLVYAIQGLFFKIFGDSLYTERIYGLFVALTAIFLVANIWKLVSRRNKDIQKLSWLPVLFWVSMPIVFRSYQMNVQENTMGVFILASVYFVLKGLENSKRSYLYILLGGILIFLASLCKGVTALFPLTTVAIYWLSGGKIKFPKVIVLSLILLAIPVLLYILVLLNDTALESLSFYYHSRLLERINNLPVVNSHLYIIFRLLLDLLPAIIVTGIIYFTQRKKLSFSKHMEERRHIIFFLLMGLAGSFPLALTLVQREFYLGPSLPFYALAFALFVSIYVVDGLKKFSQNTQFFTLFRVLAISLLIGGLIYTGLQIGNAGRDQDILHDTYMFGEIIEKGTRVHLVESQEDHWSFELYLTRYCEISLGAPLEDSKYIIRSFNDAPPDGELFELISKDTKVYELYQPKE
jgi:4-amino-4-deoxy-L-arabinose transferase-like glycosyltransferase